MGEDNAEDYVEVATSVEVAKKPHRSQYIAPMAMNKVVNLGKNRRVIASKFSDPETVKHNHSKSVLTMGEVISSNKGARQQEVLKQNFAKASTIKGGSKKHFTLVDEDDDIFQDAEEVDMEPISLEEDGNEGYNVRTQDVVERCLRAREVRMSQKNMHTAGPKSFARIRDEMRNDNPNKELPSLSQIFERTRKRTEGRAYLDTYDDTAKKIEQMKNYKPLEDGSALVDPFKIVMNKEHDGYLRLYGKGVTKKMLKRVEGGEEPYMIPGGLMESFKGSLEVEKTQLLEMRKEIEEDHQKKKDEMEAMKKDFDRQRANLEATMQSLLKNLPNGVLLNVTNE
ncbi:hypothetical protein QVD17_12141 [Tagetes erecta]|uniref:Transposase, Ptta/En/Spm, plant n=1 Tax=Tagetes erecta TaxID=13708 RepID=A0AAD8P2L5_TARER|nr:hypothetical protein QVD17_12141 [Tagetes erecta]